MPCISKCIGFSIRPNLTRPLQAWLPPYHSCCCHMYACCLATHQYSVPSTNQTTFSDLDLLSTSNVPPRSPRFWAHMISVWVVSIVALTVR